MDPLIDELEFGRFFRGRVVENIDQKLEGRLGIFIPALFVEHPNNTSEAIESTVATNVDVFENSAELAVKPVIKDKSFIWVRPAAFLVEGGEEGVESVGGSFRVPRKGAIVWVIFEDGDVNRPFWLPISPTVAGDVIAGKFIGTGRNLSGSSSAWKDAKRRPNFSVLLESHDGDVVYIDENADTKSAVIRLSNGHTISMTDAEEKGIVIETAKHHLINLDDNSGEIRIATQTLGVSLTMNDDGNVRMKAKANLDLLIDGNLAAKVGGSLSAQIGGSTTIKSTGPVTVTAPMVAFKQG